MSNDFSSASAELFAAYEKHLSDLKSSILQDPDDAKVTAGMAQLRTLGTQLLDLKLQIDAINLKALKTTLDAAALGALAQQIRQHAQETSLAVGQYTDSLDRAKGFADQMNKGIELAKSVAARLV